MKTRTTLIVVCMLLITTSGYAQDNYPNTTAKTESPIGTLEYKGGFPTQPTIDRAFDQLDRQRATQAYLEFMPMTSVNSIFEAHIRDYGWKTPSDIQIYIEPPQELFP